MKKAIIFAAAISIFFICSHSSSLQAGTVMIGAKAWYAEWDSAMGKAIGDYLVAALDTDPYYITMDATMNPGRGYLIGPLLGYQTDDNQWSFSIAFMLLNSFKQKTDMNGTGEFLGVNMDVTTKLERRDLDASISYLLSSYFKLIFGFKYVTASYDVNYQIEGYGTEQDFIDVDAKSYIPTAGIGFAYPVTESLVLGLQGGILYVISDYENTTTDEKIDTDRSYGINVEPNISYLLMKNVLFQLGIRYQAYSVKFTDPYFDVTKNDRFLGATLTAIYLW